MAPRLFESKPGIRLAESPTVTRLYDQADGLPGVKQTLALMRRCKNDYKIHPAIRGLAIALTMGLPQKDYAAEIAALTDYVKYRVRYIRDVAGVETVQTPLKTLELGQGDCDDKVTLLGALLESIGHPCRFRAMGFRPGSLCHVICDVSYQGKWLPLETTEPEAPGWEPPGIQESMTDENLSGLIDSVKDKITGDITKPWDIKGKLSRDTATIQQTPVIGHVVDRVVKWPWLGMAINAVSVFVPWVKFIGYAVQAYKLGTALGAQADAAERAGRPVLPNGMTVIEARRESKRLLQDADNAMALAQRTGDVERALDLTLYATLAGAGSLAFLIKRHLDKGNGLL